MELAPHPTLSKPEAPVMVCILDGWGENKVQDEYNAIASAETPVTDALKETAPDRWRTVQVRRGVRSLSCPVPHPATRSPTCLSLTTASCGPNPLLPSSRVFPVA